MRTDSTRPDSATLLRAKQRLRCNPNDPVAQRIVARAAYLDTYASLQPNVADPKADKNAAWEAYEKLKGENV